MKKLYSDQDLEHWQTSANREFQILQKRLGEDPYKSNDVQGLSLLSLAHLDKGFVEIALGNKSDALKHIQESVKLDLQIFNLADQGVEAARGYISTGSFTTLLTGYASGDLALAKRFSDAYSVEPLAINNSPPDSNYIGEALKAICAGNLDNARQLLSRPEPKIDPQFRGYTECLRAIADRDRERFVQSVRDAEKHWHKFASKNFAEFPESVCFLAGEGLVRLAEIHFVEKIDIHFCFS